MIGLDVLSDAYFDARQKFYHIISQVHCTMEFAFTMAAILPHQTFECSKRV